MPCRVAQRWVRDNTILTQCNLEILPWEIDSIFSRDKFLGPPHNWKFLPPILCTLKSTTCLNYNSNWSRQPWKDTLSLRLPKEPLSLDSPPKHLLIYFINRFTKFRESSEGPVTGGFLSTYGGVDYGLWQCWQRNKISGTAGSEKKKSIIMCHHSTKVWFWFCLQPFGYSKV